jgi:hypothetical protein
MIFSLHISSFHKTKLNKKNGYYVGTKFKRKDEEGGECQEATSGIMPNFRECGFKKA